MRPQPLLDVLGGGWSLGVAVVAADWDADVAGFALRDGSVVLARAEWEGGPVLAARPAGGLELRPGEPPPPLAREAARPDGCLTLRASQGHGFLCGGGSGIVAQVGTDLNQTTAETPPAKAEHFAIAAGEHHATALGRRVEISDAPSFDVPAPVVALLFDPAGKRLAVADEAGVTLWSTEDSCRLETLASPCALAWAPDGSQLACGLESGAVRLWRFGTGSPAGVTLEGGDAAVRSLSFSPDGRRLAASGGARVLCWDLDAPAAPSTPCGITARVPIAVVAWHPNRAMIAAGTGNGAVMLTEPAGHDALHVRGEGGGAVSVLAWSADGARLAIGTDGGDLGVLPLPDALFRPRTQEMPR
ncbi:WD40 repeat domain-containing protein [Acidisoma sp. L85]|uniref:WD40 repeat domain-containing protein n=1 Tax=Acidisoma sp. L85 TaxID=1641850 RepID=UPI00131C671F|nr:WD40 repeat domain-containing protein [Acidisoma sp. L85]